MQHTSSELIWSGGDLDMLSMNIVMSSISLEFALRRQKAAANE
jgi:hypothetical protein